MPFPSVPTSEVRPRIRGVRLTYVILLAFYVIRRMPGAGLGWQIPVR